MEKIVEELIITDEQIHQVFAYGLVDRPAIEVDWKKFNKQTPNISLFSSSETIQKFSIDKAKRILTGPLAIPFLHIFRDNGTKEGKYQFFSDVTIEKLQQNFFKFGHQNTSTHNHQFNISGNTVVESWLIEDPKNDKAVALGYKDLPRGTWMISVKVENEQYWNDYIETEILKGFSLEGQFDEKPTQMKTETKEVKKPKRKNKFRTSMKNMKKMLEMFKLMNFDSDKTIAEITTEMEAAQFLMSFTEGERTIEVDSDLIGTYMDDGSLVGEGEHMVLQDTADWILLFGTEGKALILATPHYIASQSGTAQKAEEKPVEEKPVVEQKSEVSLIGKLFGKQEVKEVKTVETKESNEIKELRDQLTALNSRIVNMGKESTKIVNKVDKTEKNETVGNEFVESFNMMFNKKEKK